MSRPRAALLVSVPPALTAYWQRIMRALSAEILLSTRDTTS